MDGARTPANAFAGITMRLTRDHRILIRHNLHFCPGLRQGAADRAANRARHQRLFRGRFPMLPVVTVEHTWTGYVCLSRNHAPGFGRVAPNIHSAVCQNAVGVTKGTIGGLLANSRDTFTHGEMAVIQCSVIPPHGDIWVEVNLHDSRDRRIERVGQVLTREKIRSHFTYTWTEAYPAGQYDLVLNLDGEEVARRLLTARPHLKVLYMSGYSHSAVVAHGVLHRGATAVLHKPFTGPQLLKAVRSALTEPSS